MSKIEKENKLTEKREWRKKECPPKVDTRDGSGYKTNKSAIWNHLKRLPALLFCSRNKGFAPDCPKTRPALSSSPNGKPNIKISFLIPLSKLPPQKKGRNIDPDSGQPTLPQRKRARPHALRLRGLSPCRTRTFVWRNALAVVNLILLFLRPAGWLLPVGFCCGNEPLSVGR